MQASRSSKDFDRDGAQGSKDQPVRTIQFPVDLARPGDTILIHPGLYSEPVRITRGGAKERPIVLRATERWQAILDSNAANLYSAECSQVAH
jgi:hypothetical protein